MSQATFELYEDSAGQWRWRLVHDNGNIIADSGEGYASRQKCEQGLRSVKENAPGADLEDVENPTGGAE
ncbi:HVO_2922 family protein [Natronomonas marina]|uniref:HVO_2922 family protein n=1 Tax=Natronomonas marina TaxID=2961939 RepID=UPI0020C9443C|nr:HVO_2922 family protein [Natronomonas marina]